jgi:hypothetical protein
LAKKTNNEEELLWGSTRVAVDLFRGRELQ